MKKAILPCLLCVIFFFFSQSVGFVYAFQPQEIKFYYHNKVFTYNISSNIKQSTQFDLQYEINKYNRFGSNEDKISLLKHLISIGISKEIALYYLFPNLDKTIKLIEKNIFSASKDAQISINHNTEKVFFIKSHTIGIKVNKNRLVEQIYENFTTHKDMKFDVPIIKTNPKITKEDYEKHTNLMSNFSTDISSSSQDRKHNIKNALNSLNKIEIAPGEIFSFNKAVGRRTAENGYRQAKIIINNEFVDGIGGGVCQVSSTLYNAALLAGLEIVEANKHSKQVSYVKYGFDAMVNFGSSDLKFRNNTQEKITIITNYSPTTARIRVFGENKQNTQFKLTNEIFNIVEPTEEVLFDKKNEHTDKVLYEDEFFYLKKSSKGMEIKSYREKYVNNILISKELLRHDKFKVQNATKVYGTKKRNQEKSTEQICA